MAQSVYSGPGMETTVKPVDATQHAILAWHRAAMQARLDGNHSAYQRMIAIRDRLIAQNERRS